ncbi:MAG TPA: hypothetical protein VM597_22765 [Gemmataceae bacterium]|nr:hypothetical protein [Gemmataceae bacterium]
MLRRVPLCVLAILPALSGCLHHFHEPPAVDPTKWRPADEVSEDAKNRVYVFLFDGCDPTEHGSVNDVKGFLNRIGFGKSYTGFPHHRTHFVQEMVLLQARCPENRFAVVGYGGGAEAAQLLARDAAASGVAVDLLVYLQPSALDAAVDPEQGVRTVTVWGDPSCWHPRLRSAGDVLELPKTSRGEVPTHWQTLSMLEKELVAITVTVAPRPRPPAPMVQLVDPLPAPRDRVPMPQPLPPEWRFLHLNGYDVPAVPEFLPLPPMPAPQVPELPKPREVEPRPGSRYGPSKEPAGALIGTPNS